VAVGIDPDGRWAATSGEPALYDFDLCGERHVCMPLLDMPAECRLPVFVTGMIREHVAVAKRARNGATKGDGVSKRHGLRHVGRSSTLGGRF
jgi:hypothetical protein